MPSWKQGFARNAAGSANPGLWRGLVASWMASLGPTGATLHDISGRHNNGTLVGPTWTPGSLDFNGSSDYVLAGATPTLTDMSVTVRAKLDIASGGDDALASNVSWTAAVGWHLAVQATPRVVFYGKPDVFLSYNLDPTDGYHTYTATINNGVARLYVDGILRDTDTNVYTDSDLPVRIGARPGNLGTGQRDYFDGKIDYVHIHNRGLVANEAMALHVDPNALVQPRVRTFPSEAAEALPAATVGWPDILHMRLGWMSAVAAVPSEITDGGLDYILPTSRPDFALRAAKPDHTLPLSRPDYAIPNTEAR